MSLRTDYQDDVLTDEMGGKRRYELEQNGDGSVSLRDVSVYAQTGDNFGAGDINQMNAAVNQNTAALGGYSLRVVDARPATQEEGIIYLVRKAGS